MKHSHYSLILLFLSLLTLQASAYKQQSIDITVNGKQRNMVIFTPDELPAHSPLMIVTHGMNQSPEYQYDSDRMYEMIDTAKFVVTYLRSDGNTWDIGGTTDQNFVIKTIDEMASRFDIDRERVYWSGFSMGSMLIHHCIANMQDKVAAFAPTSGIQFSEQPWNNCRKPVIMLECIAYDDQTFGYEEYNIHAYIENYAKHDKHTRYSKTVGYKPISTWYDGDLEKWTGGPNGGEVWLYSYHSGGHWPMSDNRHLIWNFCKRFSLNMPSATITQPAGETTHLYMAPEGEAVFPDITVEATAKAREGAIVKADFYDGNTFLETQTEAPYTTTLAAPGAGRHDMRVVVTDEKGKTAEASCLFDYQALQEEYDWTNSFSTEGIVPQGWYVSNGTSATTRAGGGLPYTSGPRILHFTNEARAFDYGLLVQNTAGKEKAAWAKFGCKEARSTLTLHAGHYILYYRIYNWNRPEFSPVTIAIEDANGQEVASMVYETSKNIGGSTDNAFGGIRQQKYEFDIAETGDYVIAFYADTKRNSDFVVGRLSLKAKEFNNTQTGIGHTEITEITERADVVYDLNGRRVKEGQLQRGIYIQNGRKTVIR